jgi:hypothetical protein
MVAGIRSFAKNTIFEASADEPVRMLIDADVRDPVLQVRGTCLVVLQVFLQEAKFGWVIVDH